MKKLVFCQIMLLHLYGSLAQDTGVLFPGDTNNDGICNHYDLLPIGLMYGAEFVPRDVQSLEWIPQVYTEWDQILPVSGVNAAFADCLGEGLIDDINLDAILLNYDSTQVASVPPPAGWLKKLTDTLFSSSMPVVQLIFDRDTAFEGDTVWADLRCLIPPGHPTNALGLAIWLTYPTENAVDAGLRVFPDTSRDDLMFVAAVPQRVNIWRSIPPGNIQFAAAGRGLNAIQGDTLLVRIRIIIEDKILAREEPFRFDCKEALMINNLEQVIPFNFEKDSLVLEKASPAGNLPDIALDIYPNPFNHEINLKTHSGPIERVEIYDLPGHRLIDVRLHSTKATIPTTELVPGFYIMTARIDDRVMRKVLIKS